MIPDRSNYGTVDQFSDKRYLKRNHVCGECKDIERFLGRSVDTGIIIDITGPSEKNDNRLYKDLVAQVESGHSDFNRNQPTDAELDKLYTQAQCRVATVNDFRLNQKFGPTLLRLGVVTEKRVIIRPIFRGKCHGFFVVTAPIWMWLILRECETPMAWFGGIVSSLAIFYNCFASALLHHSLSVCPEKHKLYRRMDHCGIFVAIAMSAFTMNTIVASGTFQLVYTASILAISALGIASIFFNLLEASPMARSGVYVAVGLCHVMVIPQARKVLNFSEAMCLLGLTVFYIVGSGFYGKRCTLSKTNKETFYGFHEVFHIFCAAAIVFTIMFNILVIRNHQHEI